MEAEKIKYLIEHFFHLAPLEIKGKLKYPYLSEKEMEAEKIKIAEILIRDYKDKIFINDCPNCGKLARTPKAKQCPYYRHDWR